MKESITVKTNAGFFDHYRYKKLKTIYDLHIKSSTESQMIFEHQPYNLDYIKYLLEFLSTKFH